MALQIWDTHHHDGGSVQEEALGAFRASLHLGLPEPMRWTALSNMGVLLMTMSRPEEALEALNQSLDIHMVTDVERSAVFYRCGVGLLRYCGVKCELTW